MKEMTYEEGIKELEKIVNELESGNVSLERSMKLFEDGTKIASFCNKCLSEAQQKITELTLAEDKKDD